MTINERFKYLRSEILGVSQQQMAEKLNMKSGSTILRYEKNTFSFNNRIISDICRIFDINEDWLRNGVEPMFVLKPTDHLEMLADEFKLDDMSKYIIEQFIHMNENDRTVLFDFISNLYNAKQKFDNTKLDNGIEVSSELSPIFKKYDDLSNKNKKEVDEFILNLEKENKG